MNTTDSSGGHDTHVAVECNGQSCRIQPASSRSSCSSGTEAFPVLLSSTVGDKQDDAQSGVEHKAKLVQARREAESKRERYAHLRSSAVTGEKAATEHSKSSPQKSCLWWLWGDGGSKADQAGSDASFANATSQTAARVNVIENVYNEDFDTIDHIQAMRFPPFVAQQLRNSVRGEAQRRCSEVEKTMARCLQDKMWTTWKCQKQRDAYYKCVEDEERRHTQRDPNDDTFVDMLTANRWKYNLGVFHGEIIGRNNLMRYIWKEHFPDRELPHPWVNDE